MKKLVLFVATIVAVAFAACCNTENAEQAEEAPIVEEIIAEEAPAEEIIAEEAPAEEIIAEEAPAEEAPAE